VLEQLRLLVQLLVQVLVLLLQLVQLLVLMLELGQLLEPEQPIHYLTISQHQPCNI
jgi:hypothetical protein